MRVGPRPYLLSAVQANLTLAYNPHWLLLDVVKITGNLRINNENAINHQISYFYLYVFLLTLHIISCVDSCTLN